MERPEHGGGGGARTGAEHSPGNGRRTSGDRCAVYAGERGGAVCAAGGRGSWFGISDVGRSTNFFPGSRCRNGGFDCRGDFAHHVLEWCCHERFAHGLCPVPRRELLSAAGASTSPLSYALYCHSGAGGVIGNSFVARRREF